MIKAERKKIICNDQKNEDERLSEIVGPEQRRDDGEKLV